MKKTILFLGLTLGVGFLTNSCSRDNSEGEVKIENYTLTPANVTINYDKTQQFYVKNGSVNVSPSEFTWKSSDDKRGSIDVNGILTAKKVGTFEISATKNGKVVTAKVMVEPYQKFFTEPILEFGKTKEEIKALEKRELVRETNSALAYKGENGDIKNVGYTFDSNGKMITAIVLFPSPYNIDNVTTFYKERYLVLGSENGVVSMKNLDTPIFMNMGVNTSLGLHVVYTKQ